VANPHPPVCRLCRREGVKLFLKGDKCLGERCTFTKRNATPPGQHGLSRRRRISDYGVQLRAKQRGRRIYGVLETQFQNYFAAAATRKGVTGTVLLQMLEQRLGRCLPGWIRVLPPRGAAAGLAPAFQSRWTNCQHSRLPGEVGAGDHGARPQPGS